MLENHEILNFFHSIAIYRLCVARLSPLRRYRQTRNSRSTAKNSPNPPRASWLQHPRRCGACSIFHNLHTTGLSVDNSCFCINKINTRILVFHDYRVIFTMPSGLVVRKSVLFSLILTLVSGFKLFLNSVNGFACPQP
jgi:hypothetical protein